MVFDITLSKVVPETRKVHVMPRPKKFRREIKTLEELQVDTRYDSTA
jgi:hypothetical protein